MSIRVYTLRVSNFLIVNYCYVVTFDKSALLIDPAWELDKIEKTLKEQNVNLIGILLTHHHPDHVNLAPTIAKKYGIPVYMSKIEIDFYHYTCVNLIALEDFASFNFNEVKITPILTPGHTKGGISYLIGNNLFCGDTLFIEGCGICSGPGADAGIMFQSLQFLKRNIPADTLIYPGHSYGHPVGKPFHFLLQNNLYLMINNEDEFIKYRMRPNQKNLFQFK